VRHPADSFGVSPAIDAAGFVLVLDVATAMPSSCGLAIDAEWLGESIHRTCGMEH
jgi:hypothetical protein